VTSATPSTPGTVAPRSILEHGSDGVLAVHSCSKRSNLAGLRAGFYAGDEELVASSKSVRQHAGLHGARPVQAAVAVAYNDDEHVERPARALPVATRDDVRARLARLWRGRPDARGRVLSLVLEGGSRRMGTWRVRSPSARHSSSAPANSTARTAGTSSDSPSSRATNDSRSPPRDSEALEPRQYDG
jgi:hypothetical protein